MYTLSCSLCLLAISVIATKNDYNALSSHFALAILSKTQIMSRQQARWEKNVPLIFRTRLHFCLARSTSFSLFLSHSFFPIPRSRRSFKYLNFMHFVINTLPSAYHSKRITDAIARRKPLCKHINLSHGLTRRKKNIFVCICWIAEWTNDGVLRQARWQHILAYAFSQPPICLFDQLLQGVYEQ